MSICDNNITGQPFSEEVILEQMRRDYGLSEINNINGGVVGCVEIFNGPLFTSNFTTLVTGMTETSDGVFNLSDDTLLYFNYTFTGNTDTLTAYTGNFEYQVYSRNPLSGFTDSTTLTGTSIPLDTFESGLTYSASTSFSGITASGLTLSDLISNVVSDNEYILNSNYSFILNDCLYGDIIVSDNLKNTYDEDYSLYFVTLSNPSIPVLGPFIQAEPQTPGILTTTRETTRDGDETYVFGVPTTTDTSSNPNCQLITETLEIDTTTPDTFVLEYKPYNDTLMISVNGITLSEIDYTITDFVIVTLSKSLDVNKDSITATYLACDRDIDSIKSEVYQITGITSGSTSAYTSTEKVYYNTDHSKYEYYVDDEISDEDNTIMYVNGIKLIYGLDFYRSTSVENRIIFNDTTLVVSDTIHVIYNVGDNVEGDYGVIGSDGNTFEWVVAEPTTNVGRLSGEFIFEVTNSSDSTFTTPIDQQTIAYDNGTSNYNTTINRSLLSSKTTYLWRVTSNKTYTGLLDNEYITTNVSKIGKFFTNNTINSY